MAKKVSIKPATDAATFEKEVGKMLKSLIKRDSKAAFKDLAKGASPEVISSKIMAIKDTADAYLKTYMDTSLSVTGRKEMMEVSQAIGVKKFVYIGGTIDTTREFCNERDGGTFRKSTIESWADEEWDGKIEGTDSSNIFEYCGGWNCRHQLVPVV